MLAYTAQSTEMSSGERTLAPATSCQMPMAMVEVSRMSATQCSQMSPAELFCSLPLPLAVALKDCTCTIAYQCLTSILPLWDTPGNGLPTLHCLRHLLQALCIANSNGNWIL